MSFRTIKYSMLVALVVSVFIGIYELYYQKMWRPNHEIHHAYLLNKHDTIKIQALKHEDLIYINDYKNFMQYILVDTSIDVAFDYVLLGTETPLLVKDNFFDSELSSVYVDNGDINTFLELYYLPRKFLIQGSKGETK